MRTVRLLVGTMAVVAMTASGVAATATAASAAPTLAAHGQGHGHGSGGQNSGGQNSGGHSNSRGHGWGFAGHAQDKNISGVVSALGASGFTMTIASQSRHFEHGDRSGATSSSSVTVDVSATTKISQPGVTSPAVAVGDVVEVRGWVASDGALDAIGVLIPNVAFSGTVALAGATSLTLTGTSTTLPGLTGLVGAPGASALTGTAYVVNVAASTKLLEPGVGSPSLGAIVAGDQVDVTGHQAGTDASGDTAVDATRIVLPEVTAQGAVDQVSTSSFTLASQRRPVGWSTISRQARTASGLAPADSGRAGTRDRGATTGTVSDITVDVTSSTKFVGDRDAASASGDAAGLAALQHGELVRVTGVQNGASTLDALKVISLPSGHRGSGGNDR